MLPIFDEAARRQTHRGHLRGLSLSASLLLLVSCAPRAAAQNIFNSGSTGADGAFEPTASQSIVVPDGGVLNYTTVNIPSAVTVTFLRNSKNRPVTILASGNVTIAGTISVDGKSANGVGGFGTGGPGGYDGATGGYPFDASTAGSVGDGPGGGGGGLGHTGSTPGGGAGGSYAGSGSSGGSPVSAPAAAGARYGSAGVIPLVGGSGGGGGGATLTYGGGAGGGGGGAILIASSGTLNFTGTINARGGAGGTGAAGGGGGSGGAVRLVANTINGSGGTLQAGGGNGSNSVTGNIGTDGGAGGPGFIRVEANDYGSFSVSSTPNAISFSLPHPLAAPGAPALRIASVAGVNAPSTTLGSLHGTPDIVVPTTQPNPVTVAIEAVNVPVGTVATVTLTPAQGTRSTTQSSALAGTEAASTATAAVTLPAGMCVITAAAVIDLTQSASAQAPLSMDGERVDRIEVAATFGGRSEVTYVTRSGRRITKTSE
jgi:hypothetical protein